VQSGEPDLKWPDSNYQNKGLGNLVIVEVSIFVILSSLILTARQMSGSKGVGKEPVELW
jgi:hypothetical protein